MQALKRIEAGQFDGPLPGYRALVKEGVLQHDSAQMLAAEKLQTLEQRLHSYRPGEGGGWRKFFSREKQEAPQGLYLYGGVGRGKSMLMDLFFETTCFTPKRRVHFNAFMLEIHDSVHRWRKLSQSQREAEGMGGDDPIPPLAEKVAKEAMLLCFDEFQVTDVADAMILGRLFENMMEAGVVIVATSNRAPDTLYEGGLNRDLFLPTIDMLKTRLDVLHLASPTDYRMERIKGMPVYHVPLGAQADRELDESFEALTDQKTGEPMTIDVMQGRKLNVPEAAKGVARFTFDELCGKALGTADYLALTEHFHTLVLANIPLLNRDRRNEAKRFVTLIDTLYEAKAKLVCSAAGTPDELYPDGDGSFEFQRTVSRLIEMESHDYFEEAG
ncbi:MAG: cell division protein ZapE [Alphaproteobacteria bacterium]